MAAQRFVILDFLRFLFAFLVAWMHLNGFASPKKAYLAVDFFFILSGFVLCIAYERRADQPGFYRRYLVDRIARLYPLHLATLLLLVPLNILFYVTSGGQFLSNGWSYGDGHAYTFVLNLFLLQNVGLTTNSSWNAPAWSISVEMVVNVFLGILIIHLAQRKRLWPFLLATSIICYAVLFNTFGNLGAFSEPALGFINSGLIRGVAGIALGIVVFEVYNGLEHQKNAGFTRFVGLLALVTSGLLFGLILVFTTVKNIDFLTVPLMFCMVLAIALYERLKPMAEGLTRSVLVGLGALSYAVYLCHWPILNFTRYQIFYVWKVPVNFASPWTAFVFLSVVMVVALFVHYRFELPAKSAMKKWFS
jgi:peptidoglycan/LPS O-acetylase OafA/YrhL